MMRVWVVLGLCVGLLGGCERPRVVLGYACEINTDCVAPLACAFGACRRQCVDSRDCGAGLTCLLSEGSSLGGGCQLENERTCSLTSECGHDELVCQNGTCTTPCVEDRDCPEGASCVLDEDGLRACFEPVTELCIYASDCPEPLVCGHDQRCRLECLEDRDCQRPRVCIANLCELPDAGS